GSFNQHSEFSNQHFTQAATSGMSLSPPMPIARRTVSYAAVIPCSVNAWTHARAGASLLSTSVWSMSKIAAASHERVLSSFRLLHLLLLHRSDLPYPRTPRYRSTRPPSHRLDRARD